ncbi:MFS transporter [Streptomyces beijiangensis]|uniref:MFS transporter n=1 Tax=Streptomyces beijiangensis TaxID=163361 RepID=A0A939F7D0_9ACTN|nr:MFS transporter [Streptomyces beijiangensis]MBO0513176.1 MFS transporter [Streptomyces beijiangensis]
MVLTDTPVTPARRPHAAWTVAAVAALAIVAAGAFTTLAGLFVDPLRREFGWSRGSIGFASAVSMVLYGLVAPFAAALMDRFGMRRIVGGALVAAATGALLSTVMTAPWMYVLTWGVLVGLGSGAMALTFAATVTARWFVARRGLVSGALTAAGVFGQFVFLPLLSRVVDGHGWRTGAVVPALMALAVLPLVLVLLRDHPADAGVRAYGAREFTARPPAVAGAATRTARVLANAVRTAPFWLLAGTFAICGASTNGVMWTHFTPAAHDHGMPATVASSLLALIGVFNVAGTVFSGWLTDRIDPRRLLAVYYALRGVTLLSLPMLMTASVSPPLVAFVVLFGLLDVATVPPTLALCREFYGEDSPVVFGWVSAAHQLGAGLAAFAGGATRDAFGSYDLVWVAIGAACGAGALLSLVITRP